MLLLLVALGSPLFTWSQAASPESVAWEPVGLSGGGGMFAPAISPTDPNLMMLNCDMSAAYISEDGGRTWKAFDALPFSNVQRLTFDPSHDGLIYVTTFGGSVWRGPAVP